MEIFFRKKKLEKIFGSEKSLDREYGEYAEAVKIRLSTLKSAPSLAGIPHVSPNRLHLLKGNRAGQFTVDISHSLRLVFTPNHDPIPRSADGGIDKKQVTAIVILEILNYHNGG